MPTTLDHCNVMNASLRRVVAPGLAVLLEQLERHGRGRAGFVEREIEAFRGCGDPTAGFGWLVCESCDHHRLVPFSCKGRGFCPACGGRRMTTSARRWIETVLPRVAVRQWVVTVPG